MICLGLLGDGPEDASELVGGMGLQILTSSITFSRVADRNCEMTGGCIGENIW